MLLSGQRERTVHLPLSQVICFQSVRRALGFVYYLCFVLNRGWRAGGGVAGVSSISEQRATLSNYIQRYSRFWKKENIVLLLSQHSCSHPPSSRLPPCIISRLSSPSSPSSPDSTPLRCAAAADSLCTARSSICLSFVSQPPFIAALLRLCTWQRRDPAINLLKHRHPLPFSSQSPRERQERGRESRKRRFGWERGARGESGQEFVLGRGWRGLG